MGQAGAVAALPILLRLDNLFGLGRGEVEGGHLGVHAAGVQVGKVDVTGLPVAHDAHLVGALHETEHIAQHGVALALLRLRGTHGLRLGLLRRGQLAPLPGCGIIVIAHMPLVPHGRLQLAVTLDGGRGSSAGGTSRSTDSSAHWTSDLRVAEEVDVQVEALVRRGSVGQLAQGTVVSGVSGQQGSRGLFVVGRGGVVVVSGTGQGGLALIDIGHAQGGGFSGCQVRTTGTAHRAAGGSLALDILLHLGLLAALLGLALGHILGGLAVGRDRGHDDLQLGLLLSHHLGCLLLLLLFRVSLGYRLALAVQLLSGLWWLLLALEELLVLGPLLSYLLGGVLLELLAQVAPLQRVVRVPGIRIEEGKGQNESDMMRALERVPALGVVGDLILKLAALDSGFLGLLLGEVDGVATRQRQ